MPSPSINIFASPSFQARQLVLDAQEGEQEELDLQTATELSFASLREASKSKIDEAQKAIQNAHVADGGDLQMGEDANDGLGKIPSLHVVVANVPSSGILFHGPSGQVQCPQTASSQTGTLRAFAGARSGRRQQPQGLRRPGRRTAPE
jgi:hypothetical protein